MFYLPQSRWRESWPQAWCTPPLKTGFSRPVIIFVSFSGRSPSSWSMFSPHRRPHLPHKMLRAHGLTVLDSPHSVNEKTPAWAAVQDGVVTLMYPRRTDYLPHKSEEK